MSEDLRVLPSGKGFESRYGNYNITITPDIVEQLQQGKVLHMDIDEYSVVLLVGDKVRYEITFGDCSFDSILPVLFEFSRNCPDNLKAKVLNIAHDLDLGYYGVVNENLDVLYELKDYAKDNSEVLDAIDSILEMYKEV